MNGRCISLVIVCLVSVFLNFSAAAGHFWRSARNSSFCFWTRSISNGQTCYMFLHQTTAGKERSFVLFDSTWNKENSLVDCITSNNHAATKSFSSKCWKARDRPFSDIPDGRFNISKLVEPDGPCVAVGQLPELSVPLRRTRDLERMDRKTIYWNSGESSQKLKRSKRAWMIPGTLWCGSGNKASDFSDLGLFEETDKCCREHDHCAQTISSFEFGYGIFNTNFFTLSHCNCDSKFRRCLHNANDSMSDMVGYGYFNLLKMRCFEFSQRMECAERTWWGMCKYSQMTTYALLRDATYYNSTFSTMEDDKLDLSIHHTVSFGDLTVMNDLVVTSDIVTEDASEKHSSVSVPQRLSVTVNTSQQPELHEKTTESSKMETIDSTKTETTDSPHITTDSDQTTDSPHINTTDSQQRQTTDSPKTEATDSNTETTDSPKTETTDSPKTQTTESPKTETTDSLKTQRDSPKTQTDSPKTQTDSPNTETTDSPKTQTTDSPKTQTTDSPKTQTTDSPKTQTTDSPKTETTDSPKTQTESLKTETTDSPKTQTDSPNTETTDSPKTQTTDSPKTQTTDSPKTQTTDSSKTQTTDSPKTETTDSPKTQTTESLKTETTDSPKTQTDSPNTETTDSPKTQTTDSPKTQTTDSPKTQTTDSSKTQTTDSPKTQTTDSPKPQTTDSPKTQTTDTAKTQTADTPKTQTTDSSKTQTTDSPKTQTTDSPKTQTTDSPKTQTTDSPKTQTTDSPKTETTDSPKTETTDSPKPQTTDSPKTQTTDTAKTQTTDTPKTQTTESAKTKTTDSPKTQTTDTPKTQTTESEKTQTTDSPKTQTTDTPKTQTTESEKTQTTDSPKIHIHPEMYTRQKGKLDTCERYKDLDSCLYQIPAQQEKFGLRNIEHTTLYHCNCTARLARELAEEDEVDKVHFWLLDIMSQFCFFLPKNCTESESCSASSANDAPRIQRWNKSAAVWRHLAAPWRKAKRFNLRLSLYRKCLRMYSKLHNLPKKQQKKNA